MSVCLEERRLRLDSLPTEILTLVFIHTDLASIRALRLTCKTCWSVTKTRQFWYYHINKLVKARHISLPEDELDNYTVDELENWTLRRSRAFDVFFNSEQPRIRQRTLDLRPNGLYGIYHWDLYLIPGGRWLLVSHSSSAVLYYLDLDSVNPTLRLLFDAKQLDNQFPEPEQATFQVWIDRASSRLLFRIALYIKVKDLSRTYIIQVGLAGHGEHATPVASIIATLRKFDLDRTVIATLNHHYLVQVRRIDQHTRIGVYDYSLAVGCPDYPIDHDQEFEETYPTNMEFIFEDTLIIACKKSRNLSIFSVEPSASPKLLHRIQVYPYNWATPRWTPSATFLTTVEVTPRNFQSLVIPHDSSRPPRVFTLGMCNERLSSLIAIGTWLLVTTGNPNTVFSRDWDINSPTDLPSNFTNCFKLGLGGGNLFLDEDIGRFLSYKSGRYIVIYDIV